MSGLFGNNIFTIAQKSLDFRTSRHDLLASNVANKDTPGYQAEDLVFIGRVHERWDEAKAHWFAIHSLRIHKKYLKKKLDPRNPNLLKKP